MAEDRYKGAVVARLIRGGCALIAAHTNADVVETGTSAVLARMLGLDDIVPIVAGSADPGDRQALLPEAMTLGALARKLGALLPAPVGHPGLRSVRHPGAARRLCGGAGLVLSEPAVLAADVYITSDLRHHPGVEFPENARARRRHRSHRVSLGQRVAVVDTAAEQLRRALPQVAVTVSDLRTDPWDFVVVQ